MRNVIKNKWLIGIVVLGVVGLGLAGWFGYGALHPRGYVGQPPKLSQAGKLETFDIDQAVLRLTPNLEKGVMANISIDAYTGTAVKGNVVYTAKHPAIKFMAVKTQGKWQVIAHNEGQSLTLPSRSVAERYSLPRGWYTE